MSEVLVFDNEDDFFVIQPTTEPTVVIEEDSEFVLVLTETESISQVDSESGDFLLFEGETTTQLIDPDETASQFVVLTQIGPPGQDGPPGPQGPDGIQGPVGPAGSVANAAYTFYQSTPSTVWTINHPLSFMPSVVVVDSLARVIWPGDIEYLTASTIRLTFSASVGGTVYLS